MSDSLSFNRHKYDKIRIVLADDYPLMRQALRMMLDKEQDIEVLAETGAGEEAVEIAAKLYPDIVIMGIDTGFGMIQNKGLEATKQIVKNYHGIKVLVITAREDKEHILAILETGARGFLTRKEWGEGIIHTLRRIYQGENVFQTKNIPDVAPQDAIQETIHNEGPLTLNKSNEFTSREMTILRLVANGSSNKEIAKNLGCSLHYVKTSLTTIFVKLGVSSRTGAIAMGLKSGILSVNDIM
jgi:DNA-binding NarL/FixJ family response regulator